MQNFYINDDAGNRTSKQNLLTGVIEGYTYDPIYQLTKVMQGANTTEWYSYDRVGNRLNDVLTGNWQYNASNQLTSTPSANYTYDNNGNMLTKSDTNGLTQYSWDYENRLTSVTLPNGGGVVTFNYDPFGRRIEKATVSATAIYAYDGANIVGEYDAAGALSAKYAQGAGIDEPLAMWRGGTAGYYQADGLGSITAVIDSTRTPLATYTYDAFGKRANVGGQLTNPFQYTGREWDQETGLYYYRSRYYDPTIGRFVSEDPAAFAAGLNFYSYVRNSPAMWVDPFGLEEGSANNLKKRNNIDLLAQSFDGSTTWNFDKRKPPFPPNSNKCNLFVYDVTTEAGAEPRIPGRSKWPMPTASEWANPKVKIPDWRVLRDDEAAQPGDVAAYNLDPDPRAWAAPYTGHSGIITSGPGGCNCLNSMSAHDDKVGSSGTQFLTDPTPHPIRYRRYTGE